MLSLRLVARTSHLVACCRCTTSSSSIGKSRATRASFGSGRVGQRPLGFNRTYSTSSSPVGRVWKHHIEDANIPKDVDLTRWLMDDLGNHGDKIALVNGATGQEVTYAQLQTHIHRIGSSLVKLGIRQGDVVALCLPNCPEYAAIFLGITAIGAVASPLNPVYTPGELHHAVSFSGAKIAFATPELLPVVEEAIKESPKFEEIITVGAAPGYRPYSQLLEDDGGAFPDVLDVDPQGHVAALPFSSGTTGLPKGVMLSHTNLVANLQQMYHPSVVSCMATTDSVAVVLPFFHIYGLMVILLLHLKLGAKITALGQFQPEPFLRMVQQSRANFLHLAPPLVLFLAKHPLVDSFDISSVRGVMSAAAPLGAEVCEEVQAKFPNMTIRQGYGMTESSPLTHMCIEGDRFSSIGQVIPETECKVIDINSGELLAPLQEGEICSRGPQVMLGYYKNEEATAGTVDEEGWLHSGDIGYADENGFVYVTDRLKELIKVKGFQVAPAELESLLVTHPALADAAVIGVPDDRAGELPRAFVVRKHDVQCSEQEILKFVEERVAPYKKLAGGVFFIEEVPKTASGKILRRQLRDKPL